MAEIAKIKLVAFNIGIKRPFSGCDQNLILRIYSFALWFLQKLQSFLFTGFWEKYEMFCIKFIWKYEIDLSRYQFPGSSLPPVDNGSS